ncbi:hypothetical protein CAEBREN_15112 [Caenorhabditis brenneri]|uniref:C2H2-type domain-containing protein n=1 Tax=Caenorhabditis brenneri TaxID=135651 RepID=G0MGC5_CAEBE|nr:hypothetical protein CAEBREN_15112 [Caenorhabditis brenneri]
MAEEVSTRRSFRLKDKPAPEYAYRNYLKKDWLPPAVIETNKKYDDIFSSVVTNAFLMDVQMTPDEYFAEKSAQMPPSPPLSTEKSPKSRRGPRGPYKKRPKPTKDQLNARLTEIEKQIRRVGSPRKSEQQPIQKMKKITKSLAQIVQNIEDNDDIVFLPTPPKVVSCSCGKKFDRHEECHRHLFEEHFDNDRLADCIQCGYRLEHVRDKHVCHICNKFQTDLETHLKGHYQNCTGKDSAMECRFCVREFRTVKEVMDHEQKHVAKPKSRYLSTYNCNECSAVFNNQDHLFDHYGNHMDLNALGEKIAELQVKVNATSDECPFCRSNRATRKSFRAHLFNEHWYACKSISRMDFSVVQTDQEIKQEIDELTRHAAEIEKRNNSEEELKMKEVKQEVKDEIHDDGYPNC